MQPTLYAQSAYDVHKECILNIIFAEKVISYGSQNWSVSSKLSSSVQNNHPCCFLHAIEKSKSKLVLLVYSRYQPRYTAHKGHHHAFVSLVCGRNGNWKISNTAIITRIKQFCRVLLKRGKLQHYVYRLETMWKLGSWQQTPWKLVKRNIKNQLS